MTAVGEQRRPTFRLTRVLIGGARRVGYSPDQPADCPGVSSVGSSDGWIPADVFARLTDLAQEAVEQWLPAGYAAGL